MVDLDVLDTFGTTDERLREIATAVLPTQAERQFWEDDQIALAEENVKLREALETEISQVFSEQINYSLQNTRIYQAMDLAWDSAPINKESIPLLLFGQGKLDLGACQKALAPLGGVEKYAVKNAAGEIIAFDTPKFFSVEFNLVRSVITRRLAAQANKYLSLYPHYKYEPRSTSQVGKVRGDVLSQVMDIVTDGFDLRHHDMQVARDAMLYGHSVDFIRAKWEKEEQLIFDPEINPELRDKKHPKLKSVITKEGIAFVNPHPSRTFCDSGFALASINCDMGPTTIGFWDAVQAGDVLDNPRYWNRKTVTWSSSTNMLFTTYQQYFSQYYCNIKIPAGGISGDPSAANDRTANVGIYAATNKKMPMLLGNLFKKVIPKDVGFGTYPHPVWLRLVVAGDKTIVYGERLPSTPACYCGINENDGRKFNISIGMELLPYQDQMSQLLTMLMLCIQSSNLRVLAIDTDTAEPEAVKQFRADTEGKNRFSAVQVWEYSGEKVKQLGLDPHKIIQMIETQPSQAIPHIFQAMSQLVQLSERLMALSPHELGQPAPREISATETNAMAGTTESMYGFISDAIDEFKAAKKRILYESWMACGSRDLQVPIQNRYPRSIIEKAGLTVLNEDGENPVDADKPMFHTVIGTKEALRYNYIFSSRDGALRATNSQSANTLVQLLGVLRDPMVMQAIKKEKYFEIINEIFRMSGAGVDLVLELQAGDSNEMGPDKQAQMEQILQQLVQGQEEERQQVAQLGGHYGEMSDMLKQLVEKVQEIDQREPTVDPIEAAKAHRMLRIKDAESAQNMQIKAAQAHQDMTQSDQSHNLGLDLQALKAAQEAKQLSQTTA